MVSSGGEPAHESIAYLERREPVKGRVVEVWRETDARREASAPCSVSAPVQRYVYRRV